MNLKFENAAPEAIKKEKIIVGGDQVGEVETSERDGKLRYFACIRFKGPEFPIGAHGLIMGHGDTKEKAIDAAIESGQRDASAVLNAIAELIVKLKE